MKKLIISPFQSASLETSGICSLFINFGTVSGLDGSIFLNMVC